MNVNLHVAINGVPVETDGGELLVARTAVNHVALKLTGEHLVQVGSRIDVTVQLGDQAPIEIVQAGFVRDVTYDRHLSPAPEYVTATRILVGLDLLDTYPEFT